METKFLGFFDNMFQYKLTFGKKSFDFKMGVAHFTSRISKSGKLNKKPLNGISFRQYDNDLRQELDGWAHPPSKEEVLECLYSDADCGNDTFSDFCSNLGYDKDSRKALEIYLACQETALKIRKLESQGLISRPKNEYEGDI